MNYLKWLYFFWLQLCFALILMLVDGLMFILKKVRPWLEVNLKDIIDKLDNCEL